MADPMTPRELCEAREQALAAVRAARTGQARYEASEAHGLLTDQCADALPAVLDERDALAVRLAHVEGLVAQWCEADDACNAMSTPTWAADATAADAALHAYASVTLPADPRDAEVAGLREVVRLVQEYDQATGYDDVTAIDAVRPGHLRTIGRPTSPPSSIAPSTPPPRLPCARPGPRTP